MDPPVNNPRFCRACLSHSDSDKYRSLFKKSLICGRKRRFVDLLLEFLPSLQISQDDRLPTDICAKCSLSLKHFIRFRNRCLKAEKELRVNPERYITIELKKPTTNPDLSEASDSPHEPENESNINAPVEIQEPPPHVPDNLAEVVDPQIQNNLIELVDQPTEVFEIRSVDPPFECKYCHKVLGTSRSFKCHMQLHSQLANFLCNQCGENFKTKMAYVGHMASHDPERYKCDVCGKSYRQAASLRNHKLNHSQEKPFACTICGHSTTQKSGLKKHMLIHSESKAYVCDICGDHFRFSSNLIMHKKRKHAVVKDHICSTCAKAFVSRDELQNHMMCHTDDRPFECELCRKTFSRKSSLQFHQKCKHSMLPRHACNVCGRGFSQKVSLQIHRKTHVLAD